MANETVKDKPDEVTLRFWSVYDDCAAIARLASKVRDTVDTLSGDYDAPCDREIARLTAQLTRLTSEEWIKETAEKIAYANMLTGGDSYVGAESIAAIIREQIEGK